MPTEENTSNAAHLNKQIYQKLRGAILSGRLAPGTRLPSTRAYAQDHGVSRNTVLNAYEQLTAEGFVTSEKGAGTFVSHSLHSGAHAPAATQGMQPRWSRTAATVTGLGTNMFRARTEHKLRWDFRYGEPAYDDLPMQSWARVIGRSARAMQGTQLSYGPGAGMTELRRAIAGYLVRSRGVMCDAGQVMIVHGTQEAIDLSSRLLLDHKSTAVIEDPHYRGFELAARSSGARLRFVEVDQAGLQVDQLKGIRNAALCFVTPAHQFPLGGVMPADRRQDLLSWARANRTVVFEDDYDGEFRYQNRPVPALQSMDEHGCVIYTGTASKLLFPSLRIGWMVLPHHMVDAFSRLRAVADTTLPALEQLAFTRFIEDGHLERHIHRMRRLHAQRREVLLDAIERHMGQATQIIGTDAGIHVVLRLHDLPASKIPELIDAARQAGIGIYDTAGYYHQLPQHAELILGYAAISEAHIRTAVPRLARLLHTLMH